VGSAGLFLACFVLAATGLPEAAPLPVDLYFLADPLLAVTASLTAGAVLVAPLAAAGAVLLGTVFLGRVFCGYLCPLGACLDWTAPPVRSSVRSTSRSKGVAPRSFRRWGWIKHALLAVLVVGAVAGIPLAYLFDPLAILWRALALVVYPLALAAAGFGVDGARSLLEQVSSTTPLAFSTPHRVFAGALLSAGLLGAILALNRVAPRLWCRVACPLGALLSIVGARPWLRRHLDADACLACTRCRSVCPMGGLAERPDGATPDGCLVCLRCADACPTGSVSLRFAPPFGRSSHGEPAPAVPAGDGGDGAPAVTTLSRRRFMAGTACGLGGLLVLDRVPGAAAAESGGGPLRPPGHRSEEDFLDRCVRCGICMQACPTNVIQPDLLPAGGVTGFFAPALVLRLGGCDPECLRCGEVCPTGALEPLSPEAKKTWIFGTAVVDAERCARTASAGRRGGADGAGEDCRACVEVCPYDAFEPGPPPGAAPRLIAERCTGCGLCEFRCPVPSRSGRSRRAAFTERAAIRVVTVEEAASLSPPESSPAGPARDDSYLPPFLRTS
jgi:NAD-dependent dihydropyrimidine dehydrogenase PreA subunit